MLPGTCKKILILLVLGFLLPRFVLFAQNNTGNLPRRQGDNLTLKVAVMGPGDELYFWWGHIGLIAEDNRTGQSRFYDWGVFSFDNENFFLNFAFGRLIYTCTVTRAEYNYNSYIQRNRSITLYTLDLDAEAKEAVLHFAETNMLPENRDYSYHHFDDNCATRIRDIVDLAINGQFKAKYGNESGRYTFRQHVRRHTWFNPFFDWILCFWMGQRIDVPITVWDEMFLPSEIGRNIKDFSYIAADGKERPLVRSIEVLNVSKNRPAVLEAPRRQWPTQLLVSFIFSSLFFAFYFFRGDRKSFRITIGITQSLLGLFFGFAGSLLFFLMFFTNHDYTFDNINLLFVNPLFLALIPLGIIHAFTGNEKKRGVSLKLIRYFWIYVLFAGLLTMLLKLFPPFYQQNQVDQALVLPIALAMAVLFYRLEKK